MVHRTNELPLGERQIICLTALLVFGLALGRRSRLSLLIFPVAAPLLGCGDNAGSNVCQTDAQCPAGFKCVNNQCTPPRRCDDPLNPNPCCPGQICSAAGTCIDVLQSCQSDGTCERAGQIRVFDDVEAQVGEGCHLQAATCSCADLPQVCVRIPTDGGVTESCVAPDNPPTCSPACTSSQECVGGVCREEVPAPGPALDDLPEGVGLFPSLAFAPDGTAHVVYQDSTYNDLKLGKRTGAGRWELSTLLREGAWGFFADLAIAGGKLYVSNLKFAFDENAQPANEVRVIIQPLP